MRGDVQALLDHLVGVEITLEPCAAGNRLRLVHRGLAGPVADAHAGGGINHLTRLAIVATGADPGPDPMPTTSAGS